MGSNTLKRSALPVDDALPELIEALERAQGAALVAPPGSGKTTRIPIALLERDAFAGKLLLLQPRRIAARSCAQWIAKQRGTRVGAEVGYHIRHERHSSAETRIEVITEGLLVQRLLSDPELTGVGAVILDEFHERSLALDLSLMMLLEARLLTRPDLKVIVMSATMETERVCELLEAPLVKALGRSFPVEVSYLERGLRAYDPLTLARAVQEEITRLWITAPTGHCLVFLPGRREIEETATQLRRAYPRLNITPLYGALSPEAQRRALDPSGPSRIILATNIAETSLTIDGVTQVIDAGLRRHLKRHTQTRLLGLTTSPIATDSATQRAGRAGRTRAGHCLRLWTEHEQRQRSAETPAELHEAELTSILLQVAAWSGDWRSFTWFEEPNTRELERAALELTELGALSAHRVTALGELLARLPAHPTEALALLWSLTLECVEEVATLCALASAPRDLLTRAPNETRAHDPWLRLEALQDLARGRTWPELNEPAAREAQRSVNQLTRRASATRIPTAIKRQFTERLRELERDLGRDPRALSTRDRVALSFALSSPRRLGQLRARSLDQPRLIYHLSGGGEASLSRGGVLESSEIIIALSARVDIRGAPVIELALPVERAWIATHTYQEFAFDEERGGVYLNERIGVGELTFEHRQRPAASTDLEACALFKERLTLDPWRWLNPEPAALRWLERSRWLTWYIETNVTAAPSESSPTPSPSLSSSTPLPSALRLIPPTWDPPLTDDEAPLAQLIASLAHGITQTRALARRPLLPLLLGLTPREWTRALDRFAPDTYQLPTHQAVTVSYPCGQAPIVSAPVQAFFGERSHPSLGRERERSSGIPLQLHLLAPNRRVAQITSNLSEFWSNSYPEVRRDLRGRYPKHHWPEDPLSIGPQRGAKRRSRPS